MKRKVVKMQAYFMFILMEVRCKNAMTPKEKFIESLS